MCFFTSPVVGCVLVPYADVIVYCPFNGFTKICDCPVVPLFSSTTALDLTSELNVDSVECVTIEFAVVDGFGSTLWSVLCLPLLS